jgi:hypothetical protein
VRRTIIIELTAEEWLPEPRCTEVLGHLVIATSRWYRPESPERKRLGPAPKSTPKSSWTRDRDGD